MPHNNKNINTQIQSAIQLFNKGEVDAAQEIFDQITDLPEEDTGVLVQLGELASRLGENVAAINIYSKLVEKYPGNAGYLDSFAQVCVNNGMLAQAELLLNKAIEINPDFHSPYMQLGYIASMGSQYSAAIEPLKKALKLKPSEPITYINLVIALIQTKQFDDAYEYAKKLIRLQPENEKGYHLLGVVLKMLGRFDEAVTNFEKAIRLNKTLGTSYYDLASSKKFSDVNSVFIKNAEKTLQSSMFAKDRAFIHYALGKIYNDCKEWGMAFDNYKQANLIGKPPLLDRTPADVFKKTHKFYTKKMFQQVADTGSQSETPVFVLGMPRSGSTLIEQIISSHPDGAGAGELKEIANIITNICQADKRSSYVQELKKILHTEDMALHADQYLKVLRDSRGEASRIVDKMPDNFLHIGLINTFFPKAHIIHAVRSPLDTCLSCYFMPLKNVHWAFDLDWIFERYAFYRSVMDYWHSVLPAGKIIEVRYEDLVANPEEQSKRLIESIGLEWDPACLEFYKDNRAVSTASVWQVRQPIYTSSSKRWVNYAQNIKPLVMELWDYLEEDDRDELERQGIKLKKKWYSSIFK